MILSNVTINYTDGTKGTMGNVRFLDFDDCTLTINCTHGVDISIPLDNINSINVERRYSDAGTSEETKYKSQVL